MGKNISEDCLFIDERSVDWYAGLPWPAPYRKKGMTCTSMEDANKAVARDLVSSSQL
jgi:hypothetical protein